MAKLGRPRDKNSIVAILKSMTVGEAVHFIDRRASSLRTAASNLFPAQFEIRPDENYVEVKRLPDETAISA